jgi:hypothetical protein
MCTHNNNVTHIRLFLTISSDNTHTHTHSAHTHSHTHTLTHTHTHTQSIIASIVTDLIHVFISRQVQTTEAAGVEDERGRGR